MEKNKNFIANDGTLASPELAQQFEDIINYVQVTPFKKMFPNKYKALVEQSILEKTYELFEKSPNMSLKNVVSTVLRDAYDDSISAELILQMTQRIIDEWGYLSKPVYHTKNIEKLV